MVTESEYAELLVQARMAGALFAGKDDWFAYEAWKRTLPPFLTCEQYDGLIREYTKAARL